MVNRTETGAMRREHLNHDHLIPGHLKQIFDRKYGTQSKILIATGSYGQSKSMEALLFPEEIP